MKTKRLGDMLISLGIINYDQLEQALNLQKKTKNKLGKTLIELGFLREKELYEVLQMQYGIPYVDIALEKIDPKVPKIISEKLARLHKVIPIRFENNELTVAMSDPLDLYAQDDLKFSTSMNIRPVIANSDSIEKLIDKYYDRSDQVNKAIGEYTDQNKDIQMLQQQQFNKTVDAEVLNAPMVRLVNSIFEQAVKLKASDIHIEPFETSVRIRARVDGVLTELVSPPKMAQGALITRIKIMAGMNISEKRIPQDGGIELEVDGKEVNMRVSTLPTVYGEKVVIRIIDSSSIMYNKSQLGFSAHNEKLFNKALSVTEGIILVTGPTGSGKSTTLYAALREFNKPELNVITVEDPVEYRMEGINQVQTNAKAGLTFASALRSILRQDPDILMVGEIRDVETAEIAVRAAITGHLVLSTIHTNDAVSTLTRLVDMGMEPYIVGNAIKCILAQRLVRRICKNCSQPYHPSLYEREILKIPDNFTKPLYKGAGCPSCNGTGYSGRIAVYEILLINEELKNLIISGASVPQLEQAAFRNGMLTLKDSAIELVIDGITTIDEVFRVTYKI